MQRCVLFVLVLLFCASCQSSKGGLYAQCQAGDECEKGLSCIISPYGGGAFCTVICSVTSGDLPDVGTCAQPTENNCGPGCCMINRASGGVREGVCLPFAP
jgi:hypothetical protein